MRLNAISKGSGEQSSDSLRSVAVAELMANFPLASVIEFYSITGNADNPTTADSEIASGDTRTIATNYTIKSSTPGFGAVALKIYGDEVETDIAHVRRGQDVEDRRVKDVAKFSQSLGRYLMDAVINHELSAEHFSGLFEQCAALSRVSAFYSADGGSLPAGKSDANVLLQDTFLELLRAGLNEVKGAHAIIMNGDLQARLESIGRHFMSTKNVKDIYGAEQEVLTFRGVPIIDAGYAANNSDLVIPNDETVGNSSDCTSLYICRFGEEADISMATNVGLDVKNEGLVRTKWITLVEADLDLVILNSKAVKQISGIRL